MLEEEAFFKVDEMGRRANERAERGGHLEGDEDEHERPKSERCDIGAGVFSV